MSIVEFLVSQYHHNNTSEDHSQAQLDDAELLAMVAEMEERRSRGESFSTGGVVLRRIPSISSKPDGQGGGSMGIEAALESKVQDLSDKEMTPLSASVSSQDHLVVGTEEEDEWNG